MEAFPNVRFISYFDTRLGFELAFQCHMFEIHLTVRYNVMLILLKSGITASRDDDVEDVKECRWHLDFGVPRHWCWKMDWIYFKTDLGPEITTNYQNFHGWCVFLCHCLGYTLFYCFFRFPLKFGEKINYPWTPLVLYMIYVSLIMSE